MKINISGLDINYTQTGSGKDVLFLHGWGCPSKYYKILTDYISRGYRVTAFDFPGFGDSQMPETPWDIKEYADFVSLLIEKLQLDNPIMVGHSHGGRVTLYMCAMGYANPEKIVLLGSAGVLLKPSLSKTVRQKTFKVTKQVLSVNLWKKQAEPLLDKARAYFGSADYNAAPLVLRQSMVKLVNYDITPELGKIKASTLLIYGENDTDTPLECAKVIESNISDCGLCIIKDADHFAFAQKPAEVNSIIGSFLNIN